MRDGSSRGTAICLAAPAGGAKEGAIPGEQAILFPNCRGFATFILCRECGFVLRCPRCQIAMTMHLARRRMVCHYCSYETAMPTTCPNCRGVYIRFRGRDRAGGEGG